MHTLYVDPSGGYGLEHIGECQIVEGRFECPIDNAVVMEYAEFKKLAPGRYNVDADLGILRKIDG